MTCRQAKIGGYAGQPFKVTVHDAELSARRTICWSNIQPPNNFLAGLETHPLWSDARCEEVTNRETGE